MAKSKKVAPVKKVERWKIVGKTKSGLNIYQPVYVDVEPKNNNNASSR